MNNSKENQSLESIYRNLSHGIDKGVLHLTAQEVGEQGKTITVDGKKLINFSSYSYLSLEQSTELVEGGISAIRKYGTQFGYSRAFVSIDLYDQLESLLSNIFGGQVVLAPSTTLAHQAAMPVVMNKHDLILIDQFAHASMFYSVKSIRDSGAKMEIVRHNRMDLLEAKILSNANKYRKIWYVADGVYSMQGDFAPVKEIERLLNENPNFHSYMDDAHGMSWIGKNGRGYVLNEIELHSKMILTTSLNKAFASSGGAIVVKSQELKRKIRTCGGTLIFSTPIQPPMLGSGVASAQLHLSDKILDLQTELKEKIEFCNQKIKELGIPELSATNSPVFFLPTSFPKVCYSIAKKMITDGFYVTPTLFPAVSVRRAGIRFCICINHSKEDIEKMLLKLKEYYIQTLIDHDVRPITIMNYFKMKLPRNFNFLENSIENKKLSIETYTSIEFINPIEWNRYMGNEGSFDHNGMTFLEKTFKGNEKQENNWSFQYLVIRDKTTLKPTLMTFFTRALTKDDLFKPVEISKDLEQIRESNPYYLTTEALMMGSLVTEGNHLYLDRNADWEKSLNEMLNYIDDYQEKHDINAIFLRDFDHLDFQLSDKFIQHGFVEMNLPDYSHTVSFEGLPAKDDWWKSLGSKRRNQIKQDAIRTLNLFEIKTKNQVSSDELNRFYELYLQVKRKSYALNTFDLPFNFLENVNENENWEFIIIRVKEKSQLAAVVFSYKTKENYIPLFMGLDYKYLESHNIYKQSLYQMVIRGQELGKKRIHLGITSSLNKRRLGAKAFKKKIFVQAKDNFNYQVLELVNSRINQ